jgi:hypothetical protein
MSRRVVLPLSEWRELGLRGRRQVRRASSHGQSHPDPYVARLAYAWASQVLREHEPRPSARQRIVDAGLGAALLTLLGALLGPAFVGGSLGGGPSLSERRLARRIVALGPPPPAHHPAVSQSTAAARKRVRPL